MGTTSVEMESFQVYGSGGTKKFAVRFQDQNFTKFSGTAPARNDYELVYGVFLWEWFLLGTVGVWQ